MAKNHIVKEGEHISCIAEQNGFAHFRTIWDRPENAALRAQRNDDPHVLLAGDVLFIPDRESKHDTAPTTTTTVFQVDKDVLMLRLRLLDLDNRQLSRETMCIVKTVRFDFANRVFPDEKGIIEEEPIPRCLRQAEVLVARSEFPKVDLKIGSLDPPDTISGQRARLNNLGYPAGFSQFESNQFTWAVEEFKCDQKLRPVGEQDIDFIVKGVRNKVFVDRLRQTHGC